MAQLRFLLHAVVLCGLAGGPPSWCESAQAAERLYLTSGEQLIGESLGPEEGALRWRTPDGRERLVPLDEIEQLEFTTAADATPSVPTELSTGAVPSIFFAPFQWLESGPDESGAPSDELTAATSRILPTGFFQGPFPALDGAYEYTVERLNDCTKRIEIGGRFLDGNKNQDYLDVNGKLERIQGRQMFSGDFGGQFGQSNGQRVANRWYANGTQDFSRDGKWIFFLTSKNEYDEFEHLDYRGNLSGGLGYRFINEKERRWIARIGPGVTHELYNAPARDETTLDLFVESEMKWPVFERVRVENKATLTPSIDDFQVFRLLSDSGLLFQLDNSERWLLKLGMRLEYNSEPNPGRVPADYTSSVLLVYTRK